MTFQDHGDAFSDFIIFPLFDRAPLPRIKIFAFAESFLLATPLFKNQPPQKPHFSLKIKITSKAQPLTLYQKIKNLSLQPLYNLYRNKTIIYIIK